MTALPQVFTDYTRKLFGEDMFARFLSSFSVPSPVSIRLNPFKIKNCRQPKSTILDPVPWCDLGYYLNQRPDFTFDPLLHAGCYYVQEASSMFVTQAIKQYVRGDVTMLDLCAAPGGKSTCVRSFLTPDSVLVCNEPIRNRYNVLAENISKFGMHNTIVVSKYPKDFKKSEFSDFDVILADVPCSGEGMFRKDEDCIKQWSPQNVERCWRLQREIISDIWDCLTPGGLLIYSTCTFNTKENEENVRWICSELGANVLPLETCPEWNIVGSLLKDYDEPVYRFIPGTVRGEGLFLAVLQKDGQKVKRTVRKQVNDTEIQNYPICSVDYRTAINYLRREAIRLPDDAPRGLVQIAYKDFVLGQAKNIGSRANNLYPKEWAIRSTHIPSEFPSPIEEWVKDC